MSNPDLPFIPDLHIQLLTNLLDIKPKLNMPKTNTADLLSARHPPSPVSSTSVNSTHPNARLKNHGNTHTNTEASPDYFLLPKLPIPKPVKLQTANYFQIYP